MSGDDFITVILTAALGGSGFVGIVFFIFRHYIDKKLDAHDEAEERRREIRRRRRCVDAERDHAVSRVLAMVHEAIMTGTHNGELEAAYEALAAADEHKAQLDREILAETDDA